MAASPPHVRSDCGEAPVSLFIDTDLGTRFALLVAADSTVRDLKSMVAAEHAVTFPDIGTVAVKSFQVRRKGALYHLSDLMTIRSAFAKIKTGCFLHVNMTVAVTDTLCTSSMEDGKRSNEGFPGVEVDFDKDVHKIPASISKNANGLPGLEDSSIAGMEKKRKRRQPEVSREVVSTQEMTKPSTGAMEVPGTIGQVLLHKSNQELQGDDPCKVELTSRNNSGGQGTKHIQLMSDAQETTDQGIGDPVHNEYKDLTTGDMVYSSEVVAGAEKSTQGRCDEGVVETSKMQKANTSKSILENIQSAGLISQRKKRRKAKNPVDMVSLDIADQCGTKHVQLMSDAQATPDVVADQEIDDLVHKKYKDPNIGDMVNSSVIVASAEKSTKGRHDEGVVETSKMEKVITSKSIEKKRKKGKKVSSVGVESLDIAGEKDQYGTKHVQLVSDAQVTTDPVADQGIDDLVHKEYKDPAMGDMVSSSEAFAGAGECTKPRRDESGVETSTFEKPSTSKIILEKTQSAGHTSQQKKHKKAKKVSSIDIGSLEVAGEKDECSRYGENLVKSGKFATQGKIVNDPLDQQILSNVQSEDPNIIENPCGDGRQKKKKKKTKHQSESSKGADLTHDVTKSSGLITNEISIHASPLDPKQIMPATTGQGTVSHKKKSDVSLDVAAAKAIDEVLADLRSTDNITEDLDEHQLTGQEHQVSNVLGVHGNTLGKGGLSAVLPPKYPAVIQSDASASSPSHNKDKGNQLKVLPTVHESSHFSGVPEESANAELRKSVSLRPSDNTSDYNNISTENVVLQDDDKNKTTKRLRKKISLKHVPTDNGKTIQSLDEQVNQVATENLNRENASKADLVRGGSVTDGPAFTVEKIQKKSKSSKIHTPKVQQGNHSTHFEDSKSTKDSQGKCISYIGESETHNKETAEGTPTQSPAVQEDATALRASTPNTRKGRKKSSKTELQSQSSALEHGSDVDLMNFKAECVTVSPEKSVVAVEPNGKINFLDHFSPSGADDPYVSAESKENNKEETVREVEDESNKRKPDMQSQIVGSAKLNDLLESHLHIEKTKPTNYFPGDVGVPSDSTENMDITNGNGKKGKEKKRKRKSDLLKSVPQKVDPNSDHKDINSGVHDLPFSVAQEGGMEHDSKENNNDVIWNSSILTRDPKDTTFDSSLVKKLNQSNVGSDNQGHECMDKEQRKYRSQTKPHTESKNADGLINGRADPNSKSIKNLVKSFSMSPPASSDSTQGTPSTGRFRLAVRKVPRKRYEQTNGKSKKYKGTATIFNAASSDGSDDELRTVSAKAAIETSDDSSTSADSGISSAAHDESGEPDDDGNASLSQKSLKGKLDIGSILRGSSSYKAAKQKQAEQLDDTEVPDSQPVDIF
ncbi:uncharacterized protein LOC102704049 [Oryza brachyantha]|uniref:uncharacterized protein LOC102704049 n=1 Tax=Oryza brachyantha TaxID=4533 RepID=UPI0007765CCE|nr:uncharacterized protein LOC102704049 [Oryza brachyantha]